MIAKGAQESPQNIRSKGADDPRSTPKSSVQRAVEFALIAGEGEITPSFCANHVGFPISEHDPQPEEREVVRRPDVR
jgi:hypothetical protein